MSGFGDAEKLRAARELAQGFSKTKPPKGKKGNVGGSGPLPLPRSLPRSLPRPLPRQERREPHPHQPAPQSRYGQVTAPSWQGSASSSSSVPPPSQRSYSSISSFSTGRVGKSVIGSSGLDFIKASVAKPPDVEKPQPSPVSMTSEAAKTIPQAESASNDTAIDAGHSSTFQQAPESAPCGNILDAFLSIVAKKPTIGQEIDTLANILPKAMDLNAPAPAVSVVTPVKNCSNGDAQAYDTGNTPQRSSVGANQNGSLDHSHSDKLSPVATAVVSSNGQVQRQTASTNGLSTASVTKTKGLSASAWA